MDKAGARALSRRVLIVFAIMVAIVSMAVIAAVLSARATQRRAGRFLADLTALRLGESTFDDAKRLKDRYDGFVFPVSDDPRDCTAERCGFAFRFENTWLSRLRLAVPTALFCGVTVRAGRVDGRSAWLACDTRPFETDVMVIEGPPNRFGPPDRHEELGGIYHHAKAGHWVIKLASPANPALRQSAFAFNLGCLSRIGGCRTKEDILPGMWQKAPK